jgi:excisionase family DNA binding protein
VIDLTTELTAWLRSTDARSLMKEIVAEAVQTEIRSALEDELIDVERAAAMLDMTEGALRKAVERGQIPCQRVGSRLRFRRADLIQGRSSAAVHAKPRVTQPVASTRRGLRSAS